MVGPYRVLRTMHLDISPKIKGMEATNGVPAFISCVIEYKNREVGSFIYCTTI